MAKNGGAGTLTDTAPHAEANTSRVSGSGTLIIIGGHEDKENERKILARVAEIANHGHILVATLASSVAEETWEDYRKVFRDLGVKTVRHLDIPDRMAALDAQHLSALAEADLMFFTGGDQLEITTKIGGTELCDLIQSRFRDGMAVAGTSAGASVMSETMLIGADSGDGKSNLAYSMAPGLGFLRHVVIDQHFAQRGRIGRLLSAVARNPRMLGVGIDENTAVVVKGALLDVIGDNSIYVVDGRAVTATNLSSERDSPSMSIYNIRLHVLNCGDRFDLEHRSPSGHVSESPCQTEQQHPSDSSK
jgi:cyanophycinase